MCSKRYENGKMKVNLPRDPVNVVDFDFVEHKSSYHWLMYVVDCHLVFDYDRLVVVRLLIK